MSHQVSTHFFRPPHLSSTSSGAAAAAASSLHAKTTEKTDHAKDALAPSIEAASSAQGIPEHQLKQVRDELSSIIKQIELSQCASAEPVIKYKNSLRVISKPAVINPHYLSIKEKITSHIDSYFSKKKSETWGRQETRTWKNGLAMVIYYAILEPSNTPLRTVSAIFAVTALHHFKFPRDDINDFVRHLLVSVFKVMQKTNCFEEHYKVFLTPSPAITDHLSTIISAMYLHFNNNKNGKIPSFSQKEFANIFDSIRQFAHNTVIGHVVQQDGFLDMSLRK